jgi:hypothetical protein
VDGLAEMGCVSGRDKEDCPVRAMTICPVGF